MANSPVPGAKRSLLWPALLGVIVVLGIVAVLLGRGSRDETSDTSDAAQTSEVTVSGAAPLAAYDQAVEDPAVGATIPTLEGSDFEGEAVSIGPDDQAKVIMFVAHWCPHCQAEVPRILEHLDDQPLPDDVELVMVSTSVKPEADNYPPQSWLDQEGWTGTVLTDSDTNAAAQALGLTSFPYFVAVRDDGTVAARAAGEITDEQFDQLVDAAASGAA